MLLKNKNIIKFIAVIVLFLISSLCFADSSIYGSIPKEDYSLILLRDIFGWIPGIVPPQGFPAAESGAFNASGLFYAFNWGLLGIAGPFLCYTTIKIITEVSLEGGQMKGNVSAMWTVLRVVLGIGLLIPIPAGSNSSGEAGKACYSTANTVVMWVVFQSIKLGNYTWKEAKKASETTNRIIAPDLSPEEKAYEEKKVGWENKDRDIIASIDYGLSRQGDTEDYVSILDIYRSYACAITVQESVKAAAEEALKDNRYSPYKKELSKIIEETKITNYSENKITMPFIKAENNIFNYLFLGITTREGTPIEKGTSDRLNSHLIYLKKGFTVQHFNGICGTYKIRDEVYKDEEKYNKTQTTKREEIKTVLELIKEDTLKLVAKARKFDPKIDPKLAQILPHSEDGATNIFLAQDGKMGGKNPLWVFAVKQPQNKEEWELVKSIQYEHMMPLVNTLQVLAELNYVFLKGVSFKQPTSYDNYDEGWVMAGANYKKIGLERIDRPLNILQYIGEKYPRVAPANGLFSYIDISEDIGEERYTNVATLLEGLNKTNGKWKHIDDYKKWLMRTFKWIYYVADYAAIKYRLDMHKERMTEDRYEQEFNKTTKEMDSWNQAEKKKSAMKRSKELQKAMKIAQSGYDWMENSRIGFAILATIPAVGFVAIQWLVKMPNKIMDYHLQMIGSNWNRVINQYEQTIDIGGKQINIPKDTIAKLRLFGYSIIEESTGYFKDMENLFTIIGVTHMAVTGVMSLAAFGSSFWPTQLANGITALINSSDNTNKVVLSVLTTQMSLGMAVFSPMLIIGFTLAIYVPFIPYMLFLFGVVSWLIAVITMMFAAPMICFLMLWGAASEENPLLSRQAQDFIMQLIGLFIRPALMVAGLAVGGILCTVSVAFLNWGFYVFFDSINILLGNSRYDANINLDEITHWGGVAIYAFIMISLVNMSFTTIHALYSEVMRIIGVNAGSLTGGEAETYKGEVKQEMGSMSQAGASGAKDQATSAKDTAGSGMSTGVLKKDAKPDKGQTEAANNAKTQT